MQLIGPEPTVLACTVGNRQDLPRWSLPSICANSNEWPFNMHSQLQNLLWLNETLSCATKTQNLRYGFATLFQTRPGSLQPETIIKWYLEK